MPAGRHAIEDCPEPWWHLYAGYWGNVGRSLYDQYMREPVAVHKDTQLWVLQRAVAMTELAHLQQCSFDYVQVHRCCVHPPMESARA